MTEEELKQIEELVREANLDHRKDGYSQTFRDFYDESSGRGLVGDINALIAEIRRLQPAEKKHPVSEIESAFTQCWSEHPDTWADFVFHSCVDYCPGCGEKGKFSEYSWKSGNNAFTVLRCGNCCAVGKGNS